MSAASTRGSASLRGGNCSLATSSDWTTSSAGPSSTFTSYSIAAMARCVSDTIRVERTATTRPAGEAHSTSRVSVPARRSNTRSCRRSSPYRRSNGSSSTSSRISLPLVTLVIVWPDSG